MIKENFLTSAFTLLFHYFLLQVLLFMVYQLPETEHWKSFAIWSAFGRDANFFSVMLFHFFFSPPLIKEPLSDLQCRQILCLNVSRFGMRNF